MNMDPTLRAQMPLLAHLIRLAQPLGELRVDVGRDAEPERVYHVARRERLDPAEARTVDASSEHEVTVEPLPARRERREAHPDVQRDPRLLRQYLDRAESGHHRHDPVE